MVEYLPFKPLIGLSSPHVQTILGSFSLPGNPPPTTPLIVPLDDADSIYCEISTPESWQESQKTVVMLHGLGGTAQSNYMIRMARKLYETGYKVVRVNMRGSGPGSKFAKLPYHGGSSGDVFAVIQVLKQKTPTSPIILLGFSLGGNIALKLSGELGREGLSYLQSTIAICSPIELKKSIMMLMRPENVLYHRYYLKQLTMQGNPWTRGIKFSNLFEFDTHVTAPTWGFANVDEYYTQSSCRQYLSSIKNPCYILLTDDDPFVDSQHIQEIPLPPDMRLFMCHNGGHMGFLGWAGMEHRYLWMDQLLLDWIKNKTS